jgi:hypothetical protein
MLRPNPTDPIDPKTAEALRFYSSHTAQIEVVRHDRTLEQVAVFTKLATTLIRMSLAQIILRHFIQISINSFLNDTRKLFIVPINQSVCSWYAFST